MKFCKPALRFSFTRTLATLSTSFLAASAFAQTPAAPDFSSLVAPFQASITFLKSPAAATILGNRATALQARLNAAEPVAACGAVIGHGDYATPTISPRAGDLACSAEASQRVLAGIPAQTCVYLIFQGANGSDVDSHFATPADRTSDDLVPAATANNNISTIIRCNRTDAATTEALDVEANQFSEGSQAVALVARLEVPAASVPATNTPNRRANAPANMAPATAEALASAQQTLLSTMIAQRASVAASGSDISSVSATNPAVIVNMMVPAAGQGSHYADISANDITLPSGPATAQARTLPLDPLGPNRCEFVGAQSTGAGDLDLKLVVPAGANVTFPIREHGPEDLIVGNSPYVFACNMGSAPVTLTLQARQFTSEQTHAAVIGRFDVAAPTPASRAAAAAAAAEAARVAGAAAAAAARGSQPANLTTSIQELQTNGLRTEDQLVAEGVREIPSSALTSVARDALPYCNMEFQANTERTHFSNISVSPRAETPHACTPADVTNITSPVAPEQCKIVIAQVSGDFDMQTVSAATNGAVISSDITTSAKAVNIICNATPEGQPAVTTPRAYVLRGRQYNLGQGNAGLIASFTVPASAVAGANVSTAPLSDAEAINAMTGVISRRVMEARGQSNLSGEAALKLRALERVGNALLQAGNRTPICSARFPNQQFSGVVVNPRTGSHACSAENVTALRSGLRANYCRLVIAHGQARVRSDIDLITTALDPQDQTIGRDHDDGLDVTPITLTCVPQASSRFQVVGMDVHGQNPQGTPALILAVDIPMSALTAPASNPGPGGSRPVPMPSPAAPARPARPAANGLGL